MVMGSDLWIGVIGPGGPGEGYDLGLLYELAVSVGRSLAASNAVVINGGLGGVMEGVSYGASFLGGGQSWGVLPSEDPNTGNRYLTRSIATGVGEARDFVLVAMSDAIIAIGENAGTRIEISFAERTGKPVVGLGYSLDSPSRGTVPADTAEEAVATAVLLARTGTNR
jgi:hypothetical protein